MEFGQIFTYVMLAFALVGALDRCFGCKFGPGKAFEDGFATMGPLVLAMIGINTVAPLLSKYLAPVLTPVCQSVGIDPSVVAGMLLANDSGADIFIRIHANGSENPAVSGALCCAPTRNNPYLTDEVIAESIRLSRAVVDSFCNATGANNQGLMSTDTMTGINWCQIPVTIVEMGYMSNAAEDELMATDAYREKMVRGIADGIDAYFNNRNENGHWREPVAVLFRILHPAWR